MICPQTKAECAHNCSAWMISCKEAGKPPPPTMAEIERLVDEHGNARATLLYDGYDYGTAQGTKAALMAAIRLYGRE